MKKSTHIAWLLSVLLVTLFAFTGCERPDPEVTVVASPRVVVAIPPTPLVTRFTDPTLAPPTPLLPTPTERPFPTYVGTPTPDPPWQVVAGDDQPYVTHFVGVGETLGYIAQLYGSSIEELQTVNQLQDSDLVQVGQQILVPSLAAQVGPEFKVIPDSELVFGPALMEFDWREVVEPLDGFLLRYEEEVEGRWLTGPDIVLLVAHRFSVSPRLLLALLEYQSGWLTQPVVADTRFPLGFNDPQVDGLYAQLSRAANLLNWGYYGRAEGGVTSFLIGETTRVAWAPTINHATAGVQAMFGGVTAASWETWQRHVGPEGLFSEYRRLFGNPFAYTVDPLLPAGLSQPPLQLPWDSSETWYFSGGPHGGWASGSAWAALDFAPDTEELGCTPSDAWVRAMADGVVTRSDFGAVVVDLDGDGYAGTGWAILYMHLETRDRVAWGSLVQAGDPLGHPSCEGGFSTGTHLHIARTFNGRWISADGAVPFDMGGWVTEGLGREYDGLLVRGSITKEACDGCRDEINAIVGQ